MGRPWRAHPRQCWRSLPAARVQAAHRVCAAARSQQAGYRHLGCVSALDWTCRSCPRCGCFCCIDAVRGLKEPVPAAVPQGRGPLAPGLRPGCILPQGRTGDVPRCAALSLKPTLWDLGGAQQKQCRMRPTHLHVHLLQGSACLKFDHQWRPAASWGAARGVATRSVQHLKTQKTRTA